jgi:hypothetical protein
MTPLPPPIRTCFLVAAMAMALAAVLAACGGGGSSPAPAPAPAPSTATGSAGGDGSGTPAASNVVAVTVDGGADGSAFNSPFVSVTVCQPGTQNCQAVDHVLVDTGSFGLRLAASALRSSLALPVVNAPSGMPLAECAPFASGYAWGSVRRADVRIGGETASALPVQVVDDTASPFASVPAACSGSGPDFGVGGAGANGILGVGMLAQDCGAVCANFAAVDVYFSCAASGCTSSTTPLASQVANPVASFAVNNNGSLLTLPDIPVGGVGSATGSLVFGIGTQANNQLGSAKVYTVDNRGNFTTTYKGAAFTASFLDSGSNAIFFDDATITACGNGFYCPATPLALNATITSAAGISTPVAFTIGNVGALPASVSVAPAGGTAASLGHAFDWGLPFFFGRTVFVALTGAATPAGAGPYWAF